MDIAIFTELLKKKGVAITKPKPMVYNICNLTKHIKWNCNITKNGCRNPDVIDEQVCCWNCYNDIGFHTSIEESKLEYFAELFSDEGNGINRFGFWRPGKGCLLEPCYKSEVCLTRVCDSETMSELELGLLELVRMAYKG